MLCELCCKIFYLFYCATITLTFANFENEIEPSFEDLRGCLKGLPYLNDFVGQSNNCSHSDECPINYECTLSERKYLCCPTKEHVCFQPLNFGIPCNDRTKPSVKFYFHAESRSCLSFPYLGCAGNDNNFVTLQHCESFCNRQTECLSAKDEGVKCYSENNKWAPNYVRRYYFSQHSRICEQFKYFGCAGNGNNFRSFDECYDRCRVHKQESIPVLRCPYSNQNSFVPFGSVLPKSCTPGLEDCPPGFACYSAANVEGFVCCTSQFSRTIGECPSYSRVYVNTTTKYPQKCSLQNRLCPSGFSCLYSSGFNENYCCLQTALLPAEFLSPLFKNVCQFGQPYFYPNTRIPLNCLGNEQNCPNGYVCEELNRNKFPPICCPTSANVVPIPARRYSID